MEDRRLDVIKFRRQFFLNGFHGEVDPGKGPAGFVVLLPCNTPALHFLRVEQSGRQSLEFLPMPRNGLKQVGLHLETHHF
jgi:hypothetical protein